MSDDSEQDRRDASLSQVWSRLDEYEAEHPQRPYATVLRLRDANPKSRSSELADVFSRQKGASISAAGFRRLLQHARRKFAELVVEFGV
jgi:hypothetical protein